MGKIVCFGEIMLRLAPKGFLRFSQANSFGAIFGGAEANVAVSLSEFNMNTEFVTKLPDNDISKCAIKELNKHGVSTKNVAFGGDRIGIYFIEKGASQRPSKVVYDRKYSSISAAKKEDFDFDQIFENCDLFHITGISPALSEHALNLTFEFCKIAKQKNIKISCDSNYRKNLWSKEQASKTLIELMKFVDVLFTNEEDAKTIFQVKSNKIDGTTGNLNFEGLEEVAKELAKKYKLSSVSMTMRESISASENNFAGMFYNGEKASFSRKYKMHIVDRVGGGDAFAAGIIYSILNNFTSQETVEFATACACLKHSVEGDFNLVSLNEVKALANGSADGRVLR